MDAREMDAVNPELYQEARKAIMGEDEPGESTPEPEGLDESSTVKDNEGEPAGASEENAQPPSESETPETPGPEQTESSPPARFAFAGREFSTLDEAERSYKEQQAQATRMAQELAELKRAAAQQQETQRLLAPVEELDQNEYARLEQEATRYGVPVQTYRAMMLMRVEERRAAEQEHLSSAVEHQITNHPNFGQDREYVRQALETDPYLFQVPDGLPLREQERILRDRIDRLFQVAGRERFQREQSAREEAIRKASIAEYERQQQQAKQAASTEAGTSKAAAPPSKPSNTGDAGDELIALWKQRRGRMAWSEEFSSSRLPPKLRKENGNGCD